MEFKCYEWLTLGFTHVLPNLHNLLKDFSETLSYQSLRPSEHLLKYIYQPHHDKEKLSFCHQDVSFLHDCLSMNLFESHSF